MRVLGELGGVFAAWLAMLSLLGKALTYLWRRADDKEEGEEGCVASGRSSWAPRGFAVAHPGHVCRLRSLRVLVVSPLTRVGLSEDLLT